MNWRMYLGLFTIPFSLLLLGFENPEAKKDEAEIRQASQNYVEAFNKQDPDATASFWTQDAAYANPATGISLQGHEALVKEFKKWFDEDKADKLEIVLTDVTFPEPGKALEKGKFKLTYKNDKTPVENAFSALLVKEDGKWLYKQMRQIHLESAPTNYEKLKELDWLVGNWVDADQDVTIETHTQWDKYKNFLTQRFTMKLYDQIILDGLQIIGWDPIKKGIRSWVFDSDGGYGEGIWRHDGNRWFIKTAYTLANGNKASAVHIYTKIDNNTYTWASEGRDVNGEILPNIEPVKIVREIDNKGAQ